MVKLRHEPHRSLSAALHISRRQGRESQAGVGGWQGRPSGSAAGGVSGRISRRIKSGSATVISSCMMAPGMLLRSWSSIGCVQVALSISVVTAIVRDRPFLALSDDGSALLYAIRLVWLDSVVLWHVAHIRLVAAWARNVRVLFKPR